MAADLNPSLPHSVASTGVLQILQYGDDSIDAWFKDGSRVALSGCGTAFTHWRKVPTQFHHEFGNYGHTVWEKVHQYTQFAVSEYREKISALVRFRNWFAERPFLCKSVVDAESIKVTRSPIHYATWPRSHHNAHHYLTTTIDGCAQLQSTDGHAVLELAPHRQTFTASYVLPLPTPPPAPPTTGSVDDPHRDPATEFRHAWTTELHTLTRVPDVWRHPVDILLREASGSQLTATDSCDSDKENEPEGAEISTPLPLPLPLTCTQAHLHKLDPTEQAGTAADCNTGMAVKVMFSEGIVYCLVPGSSPLCVEALPAPSMATLLRSRDRAGRFFSCWAAQQDGKIVEHVYCTEQPPPSSAHAQGYSLARVMGVASRMLNTASKMVGDEKLTPCWQHPSPSSMPPSHTLATVHVPGLGRFSAHSNGHVRVLFADRTAVDLFCTTFAPQPCKTLPLGGGVELEGGVCRLLLPNGRYQLVSTAHPMQHAGYVKVALDWCQWLCTPPEQRESFYQGTVYDVTTRRAVLAEVERIQRFDSVLSRSSGGDQAEGGMAGVLAKTARAVQEIDALLHSK